MINHITTGLVSSALVFAFSAATAAQTSISASEREAAITALAQVIEDEFLTPNGRCRLRIPLRTANADGAFDTAGEAEALAAALTARLSEEDRHFGVNYAGPEAVAAANAPVRAARVRLTVIAGPVCGARISALPALKSSRAISAILTCAYSHPSNPPRRPPALRWNSSRARTLLSLTSGRMAAARPQWCNTWSATSSSPVATR